MSTLDKLREIEAQCDECTYSGSIDGATLTCSTCNLWPAKLNLHSQLKKERYAKCEYPCIDGHGCDEP